MKNLNIKNGHTVLIIALSIILLLLVFKLGVFVGFHQARFSIDSIARDYSRINDISGSHGAVGRVVGISLPNFIVAGPDNFEKTIYVGSSTMIREFRDSVGPESLDIDDFVSVLGNPNDSGTIEAKFIRILPPPEATTTPR